MRKYVAGVIIQFAERPERLVFSMVLIMMFVIGMAVVIEALHIAPMGFMSEQNYNDPVACL